MIGYIEGKIARLDPAMAILDVQGVGYEIRISLNTFSEIKGRATCKLFTYFHVREDAQHLYGFVQEEEKRLFNHVISISGIGPSTGLMMLSSLSVEELKKAIIQGDVKTIQSVKGIGGKTAQRVILELKDKIAKEQDESLLEEFSQSSDTTGREEALTALVTLGFQKAAAEKSIGQIIKKYGAGISVEEMIKLALKSA